MSTPFGVPGAARPPASDESGPAFGVLGPLEVSLEGRSLELPRRKQRLLLTSLLLKQGEVVSTDTLVEQLWGDDQPKNARGSLQNLVSELRKVLGSELVRTHSAGYSLVVEPERVDLWRFERLVAGSGGDDDKAEARAERLREALALWRGPPLLEFASESFVQVEIARLHELRNVAREELVEAELKLGQHARVVGEIEALVIEQPLRERLRAQLMIALYRSGRQAEALAAYQDARRMLSDELGLEPSEELQRLERAILTQDPALGASNAANHYPAASGPHAATSSMRGRRLLHRPAVVVAIAALAALAAVIAVSLTRGSGGGVTVVPNSIAVVDAQTNRVIGDVVIGGRPVALAFGEGSLWVANADDGTVSRIDPATKRVVGVVRVGTDPRDLASGFGSVWVADGKDGTLTRYQPKLNKITKVRLGASPALPASWVAVGAGRVWASSGNTLLQIDPRTNEVLARTPIPPPTGLTAGLSAGWVVTDDHQLLRVAPARDAKAVVTRVLSVTQRAIAPTVGAGSVWLIVYHDTGEIWRVDPNSSAVNPIQRAGRYPLDVAVADDSGFVWVIDSTGAVTRINPDIELAVAKIRTTPTIQSAIAVGYGSVWIAVQD